MAPREERCTRCKIIIIVLVEKSLQGVEALINFAEAVRDDLPKQRSNCIYYNENRRA